MPRQQRSYSTNPFFGVRRHHVIGAGLLATVIGAYQFVSKNTSIFKNSDLVSNTTGAEQSNVAPPGIPVSYNGSSYNRSSYNGDSANTYTPQAHNEANYQNGFASQYPNSSQGDIRVYFSPSGGCTSAIVNELNQAQRQILVQAYSFTSEPIAAACIEAHKRGVAVFAVLDRSQETEQYSAADLLVNSGITTVIDAQHAIAHNKVILIDGLTLITGSFNFTSNAEKSNAENLLIIRNRPDLYSAYENNLRHHFEHSKQYMGRVARSNQESGHQRGR
jgi:phosphatidylserine/phosphatidylglycerophosphate/cardiolipin synthase-like enzyme